MAQPHVQVVLGGETVPPGLDAALRRVDATVSFRPLRDALRPGATVSADAVVVVPPTNGQFSPQRMKLLFDRMADHPRATLVLHDAARPRELFPHPPDLPVSFATAQDEHELAVRLSTMLDLRPSLDALRRSALANQAAQTHAARRYDSQLRLASQVQREFLPERLPRIGPASFSVVYRPAEYVSGDIYDVQRLDEHHVGIALADATGKGIPAALLTVFIKRALRGKEIFNGHYRVLPPDEVLKRLNDEILEANLSECRFVAATYAVLNIRTLSLSVARGGMPYPILRRAHGEARLVKPAGGVVGVVPDACFSVETIQMERGDSLLMYSDGMECMVVPQMLARGMAGAFARAADMVAAVSRLAEIDERHDDAPDDGPQGRAAREVSDECPGREGRTDRDVHAGRGGRPDRGPRAAHAVAIPSVADAPDEVIRDTTWFQTLCREGAQRALECFSSRYDALRRVGCPMDDLTVLALQIDP